MSCSSRKLHFLKSSTSTLSNLLISLSPFLPPLPLCFVFLPSFLFVLLLQGHDDAAPCAVLKKMDSFSFLQHPVHQRSLEILQRCKEEKYSKAAKTTVTLPNFHVRGTVGMRATNIISFYCSYIKTKDFGNCFLRTCAVPFHILPLYNQHLQNILMRFYVIDQHRVMHNCVVE